MKSSRTEIINILVNDYSEDYDIVSQLNTFDLENILLYGCTNNFQQKEFSVRQEKINILVDDYSEDYDILLPSS